MDITRSTFLKGVAGTGVLVQATGLAGVVAGTESSPKVAQAEAVGPELIYQAYTNPQDEADWRSNSGDLHALFSPLQFGPLQLSHRMMKSAAGSATYLNGPSDEIFQYYLNFAKGGVEFIMMEYIDWLTNAPMSPRPNNETDEEVMAWGQSLATECAKYGTHFGVQFVPIAIKSCDEMTIDEIIAFEDSAVQTCLWYQQMGFVGIGFHLTGDTLCTQFLSRFYNHRTDEYGSQSIENRCRIVVETVKKIKEACGPDFIIEALMEGVVDNDNLTNNRGEAFLYLDIDVNTPYNEQCTLEEELAFAKEYEAAGMDALCIRLGIKDYHPTQFGSDLYFLLNGLQGMNSWGYQYDFSRHFQGLLDGSHDGAGMLLNVTKKFKEVVNIPVGTVTYMDPAHAPDFFEKAIEDNKVDYYTMTRPLTVDTEYVNKLREGRFDEIAPCCRCLYCHIGSNEANRESGYCRVNALTQRVMTPNGPATYELPPLEGNSKNVMIVGGGPAGMEAARIAAARGHKVTLYEKDESLGGKLSAARTVKGDHENLEDLRSYLAHQLEINGVEVKLGTEVNDALIEQQAPDALIVAVGSQPAELEVEGKGVPVLPYDDFMSDKVGDKVLIYGGNAQAFDAALWLTVHKKTVVMVTPYANEDLDKQQSQHARRFMLTALYSLGVKVWPGAEIASVEDGTVTIHTAYGVDATIACDSIINSADALPNTLLCDGADVAEKFCIGDCKEPFNIALAIRDGNDVGRAL